MVPAVWVSAKRVVEHYFYVRERAVFQIRHGEDLKCVSRAKAIAFLITRNDPIRMM
jgi:hypothetical protein